MLTAFLDMAAGLLFLLVLLTTGNIYLATAVGAAAGVAVVGWSWFRHGRLEPMQAVTLGLTVVMGGATILLHDPRFVMLKPSILEACLGAVMLQPGWMNRYLPPSAAEAPRSLIVAIGYVYAAMMFVLAAANVAVASLVSQKTWALYNAVAPWTVFTLLGLANWRIVRGAVISARRARAQAA